MGDALAIAAATSAFARAVADALREAGTLSTSPQVKVGRGVVEPHFVGVRMQLYLAAPSAALRNRDLATRGPEGALRRRPGAAVDLNYLLSFHGDEGALEPERMMGAVLTALHASPVLTAGQVIEAVAASGGHGPLAGAAWDSGSVALHVSPVALDVETLHRLWSLAPSGSASLSLAYCVSTVLLEPDAAPVGALPAREVVGRVAPVEGAAPLGLSPSRGGVDARLRLRAEGLDGPVTVRFRRDRGGLVEAPAQADRAEVVIAPPPALGCGRWRVSVASGPPQAERETASADFLLTPRVRDGAVWRASPADAEGRGRVVCGVLPPPPVGAGVILELHLPAGAADRRPVASVRLLGALAEGRLADALQAGRAPAELGPALTAVGAPAGADWVVSALGEGGWRLAAGGDAVRVVRQGERLAVYGGLSPDDPQDAVAFVVEGAAAGEHLLRVRVDEDAALGSPLRIGASRFTLDPADRAPLEEGRWPEGLVARLAAAPSPMRVSASVPPRRPVAGDGWELCDADGSPRVWIREGAGPLVVYELDAPDGAYFGPSVVIG